MNAPLRQTAAAVVNNLRLDFTGKCATRAASYAQRAATAARRGDRRLLAVRMRQLQLCTAAAVTTLRETLEPEEPR
jgi:hypothetical protein